MLFVAPSVPLSSFCPERERTLVVFIDFRTGDFGMGLVMTLSYGRGRVSSAGCKGPALLPFPGVASPSHEPRAGWGGGECERPNIPSKYNISLQICSSVPILGTSIMRIVGIVQRSTQCPVEFSTVNTSLKTQLKYEISSEENTLHSLIFVRPIAIAASHVQRQVNAPIFELSLHRCFIESDHARDLR